MADDSRLLDEPTEEAPRPRPQGNPIDNVGPTCMFWAMVAGLAILIGVMLIWVVSHINVVPG